MFEFQEFTTESRLEAMFKEPTGKHFLDSGGAYGRHWERNQHIDQASQPQVAFTVDEDGNIDFTVSTYHYLESILDTDDFTKRCNRILADHDEYLWHEEALDLIYESLGDQEKDFFGSNCYGIIDPQNTYNGECYLSQDFIWLPFEHDGTNYVIIQIHNGCDIRGGYTFPVVFAFDTYQEPILTGTPTVYGNIGNLQISTSYTGYSLTDDDGNDVAVPVDGQGKELEEVSLWIA